MDKNRVRLDALNFLGNFDYKIRTKFSNICAKTGQYDVPSELFQKRTSRKNRVLLPWKDVKNSRLTVEQLRSFSGGVAVEFVNEDYFLPENQNDPVFMALKDKIGIDEIVSSIITIRSESGSSSSAVQRENFAKLLNNTYVKYKGKDIYLNENNYQQYAIRRLRSGGIGNSNWEGFLYICIRGGQQDVIETHRGQDLKIFNPACEFATPNVCIDLDLVMSYYAFISINPADLSSNKLIEYNRIISNIRSVLAEA